jgi:sugar O-acyltransferase (sialic acid O-acetyltransferase NeuD family)
MSNLKKNLYIIGAGDLGRMMEAWLELLPDFDKKWVIRGYLDQDKNALKDFPSDYSIVGDPLHFNFMSDDYVLVCVSNPNSKQKLAENLRNRVRFFSFIAPNSILGKFMTLGNGVIICPNTCFVSNTFLDDFVFINTGTNVGHDCKIGAYSSVMSNVDLGGRVHLGERVYIGTNATVIPDITVNSDITIGAGAIVIQDLKQTGTYFGNPARLLRY